MVNIYVCCFTMLPGQAFHCLFLTCHWSTGPWRCRVSTTGLACAYGKSGDLEGGQSGPHPFSLQRTQGQPIRSVKSAIIAQYYYWCWMTIITWTQKDIKYLPNSSKGVGSKFLACVLMVLLYPSRHCSLWAVCVPYPTALSMKRRIAVISWASAQTSPSLLMSPHQVLYLSAKVCPSPWG